MFETERQRDRDTASSLVFVRLCLCVSVSLCWIGLAISGHAEDNNAVVIDFSYAGYGGGGVRVPFVPDVLVRKVREILKESGKSNLSATAPFLPNR